MKPYVNLVLLLIVAVVTGLVTSEFFKRKELQRKQAELIVQIDSLKTTTVKIINVDSIRNVIEKKVIDSIKVTLYNQDAKIDALTKVIKQTRRKNEALEKRFDDIVISMPEF